MRTKRESGYTKVWISARETQEWAHKSGASWPCSFLSGKRLFAEFERNGDLVDLAINGGKGDQDCPADEFNAIMEDMLGTTRPTAETETQPAQAAQPQPAAQPQMRPQPAALLVKTYYKFRESGMGANQALHSARVLLEWEEAEAADLVRLRAEAEEENYFDVYGDPDGYTNIFGKRVSAEAAKQEIIDSLESDGCWCSISEFRASAEEEEWEMADSVGMHVGYWHVLNPYENWYIVDLMASALAALRRLPQPDSLRTW